MVRDFHNMHICYFKIHRDKGETFQKNILT